MAYKWLKSEFSSFRRNGQFCSQSVFTGMRPCVQATGRTEEKTSHHVWIPRDHLRGEWSRFSSRPPKWLQGRGTHGPVCICLILPLPARKNVENFWHCTQNSLVEQFTAGRVDPKWAGGQWQFLHKVCGNRQELVFQSTSESLRTVCHDRCRNRTTEKKSLLWGKIILSFYVIFLLLCLASHKSQSTSAHNVSECQWWRHSGHYQQTQRIQVRPKNHRNSKTNVQNGESVSFRIIWNVDGKNSQNQVLWLLTCQIWPNILAPQILTLCLSFWNAFGSAVCLVTGVLMVIIKIWKKCSFGFAFLFVLRFFLFIDWCFNKKKSQAEVSLFPCFSITIQR